MTRSTAYVGPLWRRYDHFGPTPYRLEQVTSDRCPKCGKERPDLAHTVYEYVAAVLAQRLRDALAEHEITHEGCTRLGPIPGEGCPVWRQLWDLLPAGDTVLLA